MQLYFIRHAQSTNNALWDITGSSQGRSEDPAISETGCQQAERLAQFFAQKMDPGERLTPAPEGSATPIYNGDLQNRTGIHLTHLYTSLMLRAVMTSTIVARASGLPLVAWKDLHECGGIYLDDEMTGLPAGLPGKNRSYFEQNFPALRLPDDLDEKGWWNRPFESVDERTLRAKRFLEDLLKRHGGTHHRVGVVSHGAFYNRLLRELLHMSSHEGLWFMMNNCAVTRIDFNEDQVGLVYTNRADFLPADLIT